MRKLTLLLALFILIGRAFAQVPQREYRRFEYEQSGGGGGGLISITSELRYNFIRHWDIGFQASIDYFGPKINVVTDYNFILPNKSISFFTGFGVGCGDGEVENGTNWMFHIMPRIGVEFLQHLRFSIILHSYNFTHTYPMLSLGVVIGGGLKEKNNKQ